MKRAWIALLVVLGAAAGFAAGRMFPGRAPVPPPEEAVQDLAKLTRLLSLTPAQQEQIRSLSITYAGHLKNGCDRHCTLRCRLARMLGDERTEPADAEKLARQLCEIQADTDLATLRHILKVRDVLTPEHRARFLAMFETCVCETCPAGPSCCAASPEPVRN
jgi:Spy/CpxP family protein refolding chaperone